jgi:DNA end-binding protein Ku
MRPLRVRVSPLELSLASRIEDNISAFLRGAAMARSIWKGAISFGLVYIPVQMYSASHSNSLDLDFLDKRDFSPVGYQRINKRTGKVVEWGDIVKGYQYEKGKYVALSDADFKKANVKATQTIEIGRFIAADSIPPEYFETPYYLEPAKGGAKVYALLREALKRSGKVAVATFVMRGRQHLAAVYPHGKALVLGTLRFAEEIRSPEELELPAASEKSAGLSPKEMAMAERLIEEMSDKWNPEDYADTYRHDLMKRIQEKIKNRETHKLTPEEKTREPRQSAQVIDLMEVLRRSLKEGSGAKSTGNDRESEDTATPARNARRPARRATAKRRTQATRSHSRARKRA